MDNEFVIKAVLVRWLYEIFEKETIKEKVHSKSAAKYLNSQGFEVENNAEFKKLFNEIVEEYNSETGSAENILEKYPLVVIDPNEVIANIYKQLMEEYDGDYSKITWSRIEERLVDYPELLEKRDEIKHLLRDLRFESDIRVIARRLAKERGTYDIFWRDILREEPDIYDAENANDVVKEMIEQIIEEEKVLNPVQSGWGKKIVRNKEGKLRISSSKQNAAEDADSLEQEMSKLQIKDDKKKEKKTKKSKVKDASETSLEEEMSKLQIKDEEKLSVKYNKEEVDLILTNIINTLIAEDKNVEWSAIKKEIKKISPELLEDKEKYVERLKKQAEELIPLLSSKEVQEKQEVKDVKELKKEVEELKQVSKIFRDKSMLQPIHKIQMENFVKTNLPYFALLSYYITDKTIPVTDPFLNDFFSHFSNIDGTFRANFTKLSPRDRLLFIQQFFKEKSLKEIYIDIVDKIKDKSGRDWSTKPAPIFIRDFKEENDKKRCESMKAAIEDELTYNTMYYVLLLNLEESNFRDIESTKKTVKSELLKRLEVRVKCIQPSGYHKKIDEDENISVVDAFVDMLLKDVSSKSEIENKIQELQINSLKELYKTDFNQYFTDVEEIQEQIQDLYIESAADIHTPVTKEIEALSRVITSDRIPTSKNLLFMFVPSEARSDLSIMSTKFSRSAFRNKIINIVENIQKNIQKTQQNLGKAEAEYVEQLLENKEIDPIDSEFLLTFIKYYGNLSRLPMMRNTGNLSLDNISQYPKYIQSIISTKVRQASELSAKEFKKAFSVVKSQQTELLTQLQVELGKKSSADTEKLTRLINSLDFEAEVKSRLLRLIKEGEIDNIYLLLKASELKTKKMLNPLEYLGVRRAYRNKKLQERQTSTIEILERIPNVSGPLQRCIELHMLAPWKKLHYTDESTIERHILQIKNRPDIFNKKVGFTYFIADPNRENYKEILMEEEQLFFSHQEIPLKEFSLNAKEDFGHTWNGGRIYMTSTYFWKIYCSGNNATWEDDKLVLTYSKKNKDGVQETHVQKFMIGIFYRGLNADELITNVLTKQDFENERQWLQEHSVSASKYYDFCRLNLNLVKRVKESAREKGLSIITDTLTLFYSKYSPSINELKINYQSRKLEECIFQSKPEFTLYDYIKLVRTLTYFLDINNSFNEFISYYKTLFINAPPSNYTSIIFTEPQNYVPEIYALSINNRDQFISAAKYAIEAHTNMDCKYLYNISNVSRSSRHVDSSFFTYKLLDTVSIKLHSLVYEGIDANSLRNVCVNRDSLAGKPDIVINSNDQLYCFSRETVKDIILDKLETVNSVPDAVVSQLKNTYTENMLDYAIRLNIIKDEINYYVSNNLDYLIDSLNIKFTVDKNGVTTISPSFKDISSIDKKYYFVFDDFFIELFIRTNLSLSDDEKNLTLDHLLEQIMAEYFKRIEVYMDSYFAVNPEIRIALETSTIDYEEKRQSIVDTMLNDLNIKLGTNVSSGIGRRISEYLNHKFRIDEAEKHQVYNCLRCGKDVQTPVWTTYHGINRTVYCSSECFSRINEVSMFSDDSTDGKIDLIRSLTAPFIPERFISPEGKVIPTPDDIISVSEKEYGITLNQFRMGDVEYTDRLYDYNTIYGNILLSPSFKLPLEVLKQRKQILDLLAKRFNISSRIEDENEYLSDIYAKLTKNAEFIKLFDSIANSYISDSINTKFEQQVMKFAETQSQQSIDDLAERFNLVAVSKGELIEKIKREPAVQKIIGKYQRDNKLIDYGIQVTSTSEKEDNLITFAKKLARDRHDRIKQINFKEELFIPFMKQENIQYNDQFLHDYHYYDNFVKVLDSFGEALKSLRDVRNKELIMQSTNKYFARRLIDEFMTRGRAYIENGKRQVQRFSTKSEAIDYVTVSLYNSPVTISSVMESSIKIGATNSEDELYNVLGFEFIKSGSSTGFAEFLLTKYNYVSHNIYHINYIQYTLRRLRDEFIKEVRRISLPEMEEEPLIRRKIKNPMKLLGVTTEKQDKKVKRKTREQLAQENAPTDVGGMFSAFLTRTALPERSSRSHIDEIVNTIMIRSERALKELFTILYHNPGINVIRVDTPVTIVDAPSAMRVYIGQEGIVDALPRRSGDYYMIRAKSDGMLLGLHRKDFKISENDVIEPVSHEELDEILYDEMEKEMENEFEEEGEEETPSALKEKRRQIDVDADEGEEIYLDDVEDEDIDAIEPDYGENSDEELENEGEFESEDYSMN